MNKEEAMAQLTRRELVCSLLTGLGSVGLVGSRGHGQTPARSPLTSALALATALVPNLEEVISVYSKWLGFVVHWRGKVPAAEANFWEAPAVAGRPAAVLGPKDRDLGLLAKHGRIVVVGNRAKTEIDARQAMGRDATILGMTLFNVSEADFVEIHAGLIAGLANGTLNPVVGREMPLADAARAHEAIMEPGALGKTVLVP